MKMFFRSQNSSDLLCEKIDLVIKKNNRTIYSNSESSEQFNLGKNGIQTPTGKVRKLFIFTRGLPGAISSFLVLLIHTASRINCNLLEKKKIFYNVTCYLNDN